MNKVQNTRVCFSRNKLAAAISTALALGPLPLFAAPTGGVVVSGSAVIGQSGTVTTVAQSTQKAAINWQGFSVGAGETVNFQQPNAASITLNRVVGNERSVIEGALKANGQIFLINSNGVLFTQGSSVNAAGLVASTLDISNEDFEAGRYVFQGNGAGGAVINLGTLSAADGGYIALLGEQAVNEGVILATRGTVAMSAGERITLNFNGDSQLSVSIDQGALDALVENKQAIYADGGKVFLTAKAADELLGSQVNNSGLVQAHTLDDLKGEIIAYAYGGTASIAGTLDASAPTGGDGGFIETSGDKVKIAEDVTITTRSATGKTGMWLIDPDGFTVANSGGDISATFLSSLLASDATDLTISSVQGSGSGGDLNVNDAVSWSSNAKLTLQATRDINVNAAITATGDSAGLTLTAGRDIDVNADITLSGANASLAMTYGGGYYILMPTNYAGTVLDESGNPVANQIPADVTFASITLDGAGAHLSINGQSYTLIHSMDQLAAIGATTGYYALATDLDAATWSSSHVGRASVVADLSGVLAGLGHTVSNLTLNAVSSENVGLIGKTTAAGTTIRDIGLLNVDTRGFNNVGALLGRSYGSLNISNAYSTGYVSAAAGNVGGLLGGVIANGPNSVSFAYSDADVESLGYSGGLIGNAKDLTITNSHATGSVTATAGTSGSSVGGLIGYAINLVVSSAYAIGDVSAVDMRYVGGLVGYVGKSTSSTMTLTVKDSFATGSVLGGYEVGGLIGTAKGKSSSRMIVDNSYATGDVEGTYISLGSSAGGSAGGLIGYIEYVDITNSHANGDVSGAISGFNNIGGLVGYGLNSTISKSYATGNVSGNKDYPNSNQSIGGFVGGGTFTISDSYATGNVSGLGDVGGFLGAGTVSISKSYSTGNVSGHGNVGGFAGASYGTITDSTASGTVTGVDYTNPTTGKTQSSFAVGGFSGTNGATLDRVEAKGAVTGGDKVGGLVGINSGRIINSIAGGLVTGSGVSVGGLVGLAERGSALINSYWNVSTTGQRNGVGQDDGAEVDGSTGLDNDQFRDVQHYLDGTIGQILADRQAAAEAAADAAKQAAALAAAKAAAEAAAFQLHAEAGAQAAASAMAEARRRALEPERRNSFADSGALPRRSDPIENNIAIADVGIFSANIRRIEIDGVIYEIDEDVER